MERWAIQQDQYAIAIRVPEGGVCHSVGEVETDYSDINRYLIAHEGKDVAILAVGNFFQKGEQVSNLLKQKGIDATLVNPRWLSGEDKELLHSLEKEHKLVVTLEDGCLDGGFGERIARFYGNSNTKVLCFGVEKKLYDRYDINELLRKNHLTNEQIVEDILSTLEQE